MDKGRTTRTVKLIAIGNSKGIRIPKVLLQKHGWRGSLVLEEREDGVFLYSKEGTKLSWEQTCRAMATEREDWSDLETAVADGLD
ncbi:MAG: AbrB/MazE/SpoVT family DNA-binding domain-containing protein [Acidobacteria bacterium]|nr:AbrB/MazE/SpoVT family DNA-binding domain-containing protein [Acidobacteriota bacterium]